MEKKLSTAYDFSQIIGHSNTLAEAISLAKKVAINPTTFLLLGEMGTGKEVFAQAITTPSTENKSLTAHFLGVFAAKINKRVVGMTEEMKKKLREHPWKGNIRELKNRTGAYPGRAKGIDDQ